MIAIIAGGVAVGGILERGRASSSQRSKLANIAAVERGHVLATNLDDYWYGPSYTCLIYRVGNNDFALRLCFDSKGRLVLGNDDRNGADVLGDLRWLPERTPFRVDPAEIRHAVSVVQLAQRQAEIVARKKQEKLEAEKRKRVIRW